MRTIGIDFDSTLAAYDGWKGPEEIGDPNPALLDALWRIKADGAVLCTWTCRSASAVKKWLKKYELEDLFEYINESPYPTETAKASFDLLIDDTAHHWDGTLNAEQTYQMMRDRLHLSTHLFDAEISRDIDYSDRNPKLFYQGTGNMFVDHFEDLWMQLWDGIDRKPIAFLTICAHAKPYSKSAVHSRIREHLWSRGLLDHVTYTHLSGAGLIPSEREMEYPFNAYDGNMAEATDNARAHLRDTLTRRMGEWWQTHGVHYDHTVIYLRSKGNTITAVRNFIDQHPDPRIQLIVAEEKPEYVLPFQPDPDPDDCLPHYDNIAPLLETLAAKVTV